MEAKNLNLVLAWQAQADKQEKEEQLSLGMSLRKVSKVELWPSFFLNDSEKSLMQNCGLDSFSTILEKMGAKPKNWLPQISQRLESRSDVLIQQFQLGFGINKVVKQRS